MHEHGQEHEDAGIGRKHLLMMALCCLIPVLIIAVIIFANIESTYLPFLLVLLCPLMMLLMRLPDLLARKKS